MGRHAHCEELTCATYNAAQRYNIITVTYSGIFEAFVIFHAASHRTMLSGVLSIQQKCYGLLTLLVLLITAPATLAQFFIENRGQWQPELRFVAAGAGLVVTEAGIIIRDNGHAVTVPLGAPHRMHEQLAAALHYYSARGSIEGVRIVRRLVWERAGTVTAEITWDGTCLRLRCSDRGLLPAELESKAMREHSGALALTLAELPHRNSSIAAWGIGGRLFGGSGNDSVTAMVTSAGRTFLVGTTNSPNFPSAGSPQDARDAFCVALERDGSLAWATLIGGSGEDRAFGVAATGASVALAGATTSSNFPTTTGTVQPTFGGGTRDGFIAVLSAATGTRQAATYIGGSGDDELGGVAIETNRLIAVGTTTSDNLPATAHQQQLRGFSDGYVVQLSADLSARQWSSYYGGRGFDELRGVGILSDGSIVIAGTTGSPNTSQAIAEGIGEGSDWRTPPDGFIARLSSAGQRIWGRYYGSDGADSITALSIGPGNTIIITGMTNGTNTALSYIAEAQSAQNQFAGGASDGFVAVLRPDGTRLWGSYYGGSGTDRCTGAMMDAQGYVLAVGWTTSSDIDRTHSDNTALAGAEDVMVGFFSPDGTRRIASLLYGGSGSDLPCGIAWSSDSSMLVAGTTTSSSFAPVQGSSSGSADGFLLQIASLGILSVPDVQTPTLNASIESKALVLALPHQCSGATVELYSTNGKCMRTLHAVTPRAYLLLEELPAGVYALRVQCEQASLWQMILVP